MTLEIFMHKYLLIIVLSGFLFSCKKQYNSSETVFSHGRLHTKIDMKPINGILYGANGTEEKFKIGEFRNGLREGIHHWHVGKQLVFEGEFLNGRENGIHRNWYSNGQLKSRGRYLNGQPIGMHREWHWNGEKKVENSTFEQSKYGKIIFWNSSGTLDSTCYFFNNGLEKKVFYNTQNKKYRVDYYKEGLIKRKSYFYQNQLCKRILFEYGKKTRVIFYNHGKEVNKDKWLRPVDGWDKQNSNGWDPSSVNN
jgi:antitoxin component YwqK of YwqJK toxin-antitoxin module